MKNSEVYFSAERRQRLIVVSSLAPIFIAIGLKFTSTDGDSPLYLFFGINNFISNIIQNVCYAISVSIILLQYLQNGISVFSKRYFPTKDSNDSLDDEVLDTTDFMASPEDSPFHSLVNELKKHHFAPFGNSSPARARLLNEVERLGFRNNVNLVFGVISVGVGLWLLFSLAFSKPPDKYDLTTFLITFIPRLTLIIFIEIFAYFFLALYKNGLSEIKYFQNEITNIEAKAIALEAATKSGNSEVIVEVIKKIAATERNHVLKKGEPTVELELAKSEKNALSDSLKNLALIAKSITRNASQSNADTKEN